MSPAPCRRLATALAWCLITTAPHATWAQAAPEGKPSAPEAPASGPSAEGPPASEAVPKLVAPTLLEAPEPAFPTEAEAQGLAASVPLSLTIDASGSVVDAQVLQPAGHGFDEAALEAARQLRFAPATRDGTPIVARVRYDLHFEPPSPPAPAGGPAAPDRETTDDVVPEAPPPAAVEVVVDGEAPGAALRRSSRAVTVIDTQQARTESSDLGEVVARAAGVTVQRGGGLGSRARISLNGLSDRQVRVFLDGVPLELTGFTFGLGNVPVDLVHRVDIYRGVVPARLGSDALGGAIELVSDEDLRGSRATASYQTGSFDTHRAAVGARHLHEPSGTFGRARAFVDHSANDYLVDVNYSDDEGRVRPIRARRFHDAYTAYGVDAEVGLVDRPRADRALLRAFYTEADSDIQSDPGMNEPYGEVVFGRVSAGTQLRFDQAFSPRLRLQAIAGYAFIQTTFRDVGDCRYDWLGRCIATLAQPGEADTLPHDQTVEEHSPYLRVEGSALVTPHHQLRLTLAPTYNTRTGNDAAVLPGAYDPFDGRRQVLSAVAGLEWEATLWDGRLENTAFAKGYLQTLSAREQLPNGNLRDVRHSLGQPGGGDSLRLSLVDRVYAKTSYEYGTRLPAPDELFGDGGLTTANLRLVPEVSHNVNLGLTAEPIDVGLGAVHLDVNGFARHSRDLIILLREGSYFRYDNVQTARSLGVEAGAGWASPSEYVSIDGSFTFQDLRNTSRSGVYSNHRGERIPNRPVTFADASARLAWPQPFGDDDRLSVGYRMHWVDGFSYEWERYEIAGEPIGTPVQLTHALIATYVVMRGERTLSASVEVRNLTDAPVYDLYGVQRPGRAASAKLALTL